MNNNIIVIGVLDTIESTNVSLCKAFIKLGLNVIPVNYRSIIQQYGHQFFENLVIDTIKKYKPILTIFCKCNNVNPELTKECSKITTTWLWNPDPVMTINKCPEVIEHMRNCTYCSHTGGGVNDYYRGLNISNSFHIPCGLDYDLYKPRDIASEYISDISFIGGKTEERDKFKRILESIVNVKFYGPGYGNYINYEEFSKICSSSKFMLSINNEHLEDYFSNRLLRYLGCGSCVLHYDPTETINKYFEQNVEILAFSDVEQLAYYVKNIDNETAGKIALNGRDKVLKNYTWENTALLILKIAGLIR